MTEQHYVEVIFDKDDDMSKGRLIIGPYPTRKGVTAGVNEYNKAVITNYGPQCPLFARAVVIDLEEMA